MFGRARTDIVVHLQSVFNSDRSRCIEKRWGPETEFFQCFLQNFSRWWARPLTESLKANNLLAQGRFEFPNFEASGRGLLNKCAVAARSIAVMILIYRIYVKPKNQK